MKDMKEMMEMLAAKKEEKGEDHDKMSKMDVLRKLHKMASEMLGGDMMGGMKKVTVAAKDKNGLEAGLDKARQMLSGQDEEEC